MHQFLHLMHRPFATPIDLSKSRSCVDFKPTSRTSEPDHERRLPSAVRLLMLANGLLIGYQDRRVRVYL
jgi:hypothetical protein